MAIIEEPLVQAIERLRAQHNDDADYEAKSCATTLSKSVWESVSAFANTDGGTLLLGVDENKNFTVPPQFDADKTINQFVDGMGDGSKDGAKVVSPPPYSIHRDTLDGAQMVSVQVHENDAAHKPCYVKSKSVSTGSYKRQDDKDILLSPTELFEMQNVYKPSEADRAPITDADRGDLDDATVAAIIDAHRDTKALRGAHSEMQQLERLNILDKKAMCVSLECSSQEHIHSNSSLGYTWTSPFIRASTNLRMAKSASLTAYSAMAGCRKWSMTRSKPSCAICAPTPSSRGPEDAMYRRFQLRCYARQSPMPLCTGNTMHCSAMIR